MKPALNFARGVPWRPYAMAVLLVLLLLYCVWHGVSGRFGLWSHLQLLERRAVLVELRDGLRARKARARRDVALLRARQLDPDLLDELARRELHLVHPNDLVIHLPARLVPR